MHQMERLKSWISSWQDELGSDDNNEFAEFQRAVMEEIKRLPPEAAERIAARLIQMRPLGEMIDEDFLRVTENRGMDKPSAIKFMQVAAGYIRRGVPLPPLLRGWLADALEAPTCPEKYAPSAENDPEGAAVMMALGLKGSQARKPRLAITGHFLSLLMDDQSRAQAIKTTAAEFDVSEKTVHRCIGDHIDKLDEYQKALRKAEQVNQEARNGNNSRQSTEKKPQPLKLIEKYRRSSKDK